MTETTRDDSKRHWLKPLKGKWRGGAHVLLWPEEEAHGRYLRSPQIVAQAVWANKEGEMIAEETATVTASELDGFLDRTWAHPGTRTIWIPGGWDHLVLTGLADLLDQGVITWRYCSLESHRVLIRGLWRGKALVITSLANWTGGTWDQWRNKTSLRGHELFHTAFWDIAQLARALSLGSIPPSAGAAGLLLWRTALGPVVGVLKSSPQKTPPGRSAAVDFYVAPLPDRPARARQAERHCAYGLIHRQMRAGLVEGPIRCIDFKEAYLAALCTAVLPLVYARTLHQPSVEELAENLIGHTGCALVHVRSPEMPYPARRHGRVQWATGEYWTWLAGVELASAVTNLHVVNCKTAHLWMGKSCGESIRRSSQQIGLALDALEMPLAKAAWRSLYAQLVGRFAAWRRRWVDCSVAHNFGRWASWHGVDAESGLLQSYRSIAGRVQRLSAREDAGDSVALLFSVVTAQVRMLIWVLCNLAGQQNVLAIEADAIWVTTAGWQSVQRHCSGASIPPDCLQNKETFDSAWLTGKSIAVVEMDGKRFIRCPGVPADIAVGTEGDVRWTVADDWHAEGGPDARRGVRRLSRRYSAQEIVRLYSKPAALLPFSEELIDPMLPEALLQPLTGPDRSVLDA